MCAYENNISETRSSIRAQADNVVMDDLLCWLSQAVIAGVEEQVVVEVMASHYSLQEVHEARNLLSMHGFSLPCMNGVRGLLREMVNTFRNTLDENDNNNLLMPKFKSNDVTNWPRVRPVRWTCIARDLEQLANQAQILTTILCWLLPEARYYSEALQAAHVGTLAPHLASVTLTLTNLKTILEWDLPGLPTQSPASTTQVTTPQPPQRPWIHLGEPDRSKPSCIFTVMCYNVLCDKYATRQMYGYCPSWALEWDYRKKGIMDEIKQYLADIITLQEVETDQFFNFFLPELKNEGYDGIFSPKSRAKHMSENERKYVDGCAIFWRTSKFNLVKERVIEFNQLAMANHDGSEDMLNRVMTKDNIGLAALLETKEAAWENSEVAPDKSQIAQAVLVCTAHIHWDPEFCDVKLIQTIMLMSEIRQIISQIVDEAQHRSRSARKIDPSGIQLLLCGDLNSLPDSGVVEFLTKGNVSMDHEDFKSFGYKTCLQKIAMTKNNNSLVNTSANIYTHSFRLAAAYDFSIMAYTNYTYDFKGIIDYIFHSADTMSTLGVLGPIDPDWFRDNKVMGCPHPHIPSDHFSLLVQLEMRPSPSPLTHPNGLLHR
ncbi:hypothetical protein Pcinc_018673 [Petrolisthes cinctipes]|uniref:poly(A)-specific ribonuclease n=1 Tax=Petrolisthes cinctipes TaxID=88211 RepID=A0AAE1FN73_PETCI|nr:hypothetical protein Pcinc_018673 [Petrolisthes cinctipes]